ncbi:MAG: hypothetical protein HY590_07885 [Candidatus Omnitrophica bacterium]|nr:hypothetical protein [Candidatus Omnitrophota bacterium]
MASVSTGVLTKSQAVAFLELNDKVFENYFRFAKEFSCISRTGGRGRFYFDRRHLEAWKQSYDWRTVRLTRQDYQLCLDFALAMHFRGYVLSDWGTARQREFGQKLTNWIKGQLAEIAVQTFFKREFKVEVHLDFGLHNEIVPQDIVKVREGRSLRDPKIKVGIKASKPKSAYLVLGDNEITLPKRRSDIYIFCRPDIPDDHILRITKEQIVKEVSTCPYYPVYSDSMSGFEDIPCEIAGWCEAGELQRVTEIPGQSFDGVRYVRQSGLLRRTKSEWEELIRRL